ncbi:hypothetical protein [Holospora curviuscula]|uniref:Uncharacterized protein n=1 Tax=Holospora curviuscula TaxID=1082868 RepID=A0A2S5R7F9_9PROT|nr:hypothetical protein [Holospora curviuscula]PPE03279.1 hypothetical protein HCUR_01273 [Holospora curviuscula]
MNYFFLLCISFLSTSLLRAQRKSEILNNSGTPHPLTAKVPTLSSPPTYSNHSGDADNFLVSWELLSSPEAASKDLRQSPLLAIKDWNTQTVSNFQHIPEFKQAQSLEEVKKIILNKLLERKVNKVVVSEFLTRAEFPEAWCLFLEDMIAPLKNTQESARGLSVQDVFGLLAAPLSRIKCNTIKLPIPDPFQDAFEQADDARSEQNQASCIISETSEAPVSTSISYAAQQAPSSDSNANAQQQQHSYPPPMHGQDTSYKESQAESAYEHTSSSQEPVSSYVQGIPCLEFWVTGMIEQSMHYHKKNPQNWLAAFSSANQDPINQRIIQHLKKALTTSQGTEEYHSQGSYDGTTRSTGTSVAPISASSSNVQGSSKPTTDPGYIDQMFNQEAPPPAPQGPVGKHKAVTFFSRQKEIKHGK